MLITICIVREWVCSARGVWVALSCAGVWPGAPCGMAAERCAHLHAATSPCGGWNSLELSLQSTAPIQKVLSAVFWLSGRIDLIWSIQIGLMVLNSI